MQSHNVLYPFLDTQSTSAHDASSYNFPDGDVSLLVEQTSFRVHRDKLVQHSHVFDDMFVVAHPDDDDEATHSQTSLERSRDMSVSVRMPDTVEEWGLVFSVLYPPKE
jgi:hypothetical protein